MTGELRVTVIPKFFEFLRAARSPVVALYGGAGSGKTVSLCQEMVRRLYTERDYTCLVVRKTGPSLMKTVYPEIKKVLESYGMAEGRDYVENRAERCIRANGNTMWFFSYGGDVEAARGVERVKSLNATDAYINEASELSWNEYEQLRLRLRNPPSSGRPCQLFMDFNPVDPYHWTKTMIVDRAEHRVHTGADGCLVVEGHPDNAGISVLHSTYKDNPFLPHDYRRHLESLAESDRMHYHIYCMGVYAQPEHTIYTNYMVDNTSSGISSPPDCIGLDFGYNNPTALVAIWERDGELYIRELLYESYLTNQDLIEKLNNIIPLGWRGAPIYADSAEPARIEEIARAGYNIHPAEKNVKDGIDAVKRYRVHFHPDDQNMLREWRSYRWREDRNGRVLDEPIKHDDHCCDAVRYAVHTHLHASQTIIGVF